MSRAPWVSHFGFTRTPFSKTHPDWPAVRSRQPPGSRRAYSLLHWRIAPGHQHRRGRCRQDGRRARRHQPTRCDRAPHHLRRHADFRRTWSVPDHRPRHRDARPPAQKAESHRPDPKRCWPPTSMSVAVVLWSSSTRRTCWRPINSRSYVCRSTRRWTPKARSRCCSSVNRRWRAQLRLGVFAALDQRIATRYQLTPMDLAESAQYLRHHLALVGRTDPLIALCRARHKANYPEPRIMPSLKAA
jgi:hypothetical protein